MCVMNFLISDTLENHGNLSYIAKTVNETVSRLGGVLEMKKGERSYLSIQCPSSYHKLLKPVLKDKISDVIAVKYKYDFFIKYLRTSGVDPTEFELLLAALIAADVDEDKRYASGKTVDLTDFAIDGFFNFRLKPLREKWWEVVGYVPSYFSKDRLNRFITYIVNERKNRRAVVDGEKVFDRHFNRLFRLELTENFNLAPVTREVVLSGASEVEMVSPPNSEDEKYLVRFFGDKIFFTKEINRTQNR